MYIEPNSTIEFYSGIPLDKTYQNTLYFANLTAQNTFFSGTAYKKYSLQNMSYNRVNRGKVRVERKAESLYDCNYMRFQNTSFGNKWFYAFITSVEYVSNIVSEVTFEIDVMQTYLFDVDLKQCFVEREHSTSDVPGDNLVNEPVAYGALIPDTLYRHVFDDFTGVIAVTRVREDTESIYGGGKIVDLQLCGNLINACNYYGYDLSNDAGLLAFSKALAAYSENKDDVISVFTYPTELVDSGGGTSHFGAPVFNKSPVTITKTFALPYALNGYTPRNKKLLTFPYCYMAVDNGKIVNEYHYEYFTPDNNGNITFHLRGVPIVTPTVSCSPYHYKNSGATDYYEEQLPSSQFPQVAYPIDSYAAWLAQNQASQQRKIAIGAGAGAATGIGLGLKAGAAIGSAGGPVGTVAGAVIGGVLGLVGGAIGGKIKADEDEAVAADQKNKSEGTNTGNLDVAIGHIGFTFKKMCLTAENARIIDDYFDMFGYATNRVKVPNRSARPHWNYVKTAGCVVSGQCPSDDIALITRIYDSGITFWKDASEIGNYSLDNTLS